MNSKVPPEEFLKKLATMQAMQRQAGYRAQPVTRIKNMANEDMTDGVKLVLSRYPSLSEAKLIKLYAAQFLQYNQALVDKKLAISEQDLSKLDIIDMRAINKKPPTPHAIPEIQFPNELAGDLRTFLDDEQRSFYRMLPCFSEGVFQINHNRYIYFKVQEINFEQQSYKIEIRDYAKIPQSKDYNSVVMLWQPGIYGLVTIMRQEDDDYQIIANENDCHLFQEIYQQIKPKELGWDKIQKSAWKHIAIANAAKSEANLKAKNTNNVVQLARLFMRYVMLSNFVLENNKPKIAPGQKAAQEHNKNISNKLKEAKKQNNPDAATQIEIPEKLVRNVGLIKIKSTHTPRAFTSKSIKNYKIPSWTSRGHTRTYKSGKTVYVKPSVHHRKALKNPENKVPQAVIRITNGQNSVKESSDADE